MAFALEHTANSEKWIFDGHDKSEFRSVYRRLMYGLRHVQHHAGKLTASLNLEGIQLQHWKG